MRKLELSQMENFQGGLKEWSCKMVWAAAAFVLIGGLAPISIDDIRRCW